jgi:hypothetical protein
MWSAGFERPPEGAARGGSSGAVVTVWWLLCQPHGVVSSVVSDGGTFVVNDIFPLLAEESP